MSIPELQRSVGRIEGKIDTFIRQMETQDNRTTELEVRTRKVENRQHYWAGGGTVVGTLIGFFGTHFLRVMIAAVALSAVLTSSAPGQPTVDTRRAAIIEKVRSIGVYPGAEFEVFGAVYRIEAVTVDANYTLIVKTKVVR